MILARLLLHDLKAGAILYLPGSERHVSKATRIQCVTGLVGTRWLFSPAPSSSIGGGRRGVPYAVILSFYGSVSRPRPYSSPSITFPRMSAHGSMTAPLRGEIRANGALQENNKGRQCSLIVSIASTGQLYFCVTSSALSIVCTLNP